MKSVLYYLMILVTAIRFTDIIYVLSKGDTNLPVPAIIVASAMVLYGVILSVKKFISIIRLKQFLIFYTVQSVMILFNLIYIAVASPLSISAAETVAIGTFLDLIVFVGAVYMIARQMRSSYRYVEVHEPEETMKVALKAAVSE